MKWKIILAIVLTGGIGYAAYRYFKKQADLLNQYTVDIVALKVLKWTQQEAVVNFTIRLGNKSDIEATLKQLYADIYINEVLAGNVKTTEKAVIPARGFADISMQTVFSPQVILTNAVDIILGALTQKDITYRLKGYAQLSSGFVPVSVPFENTGSVKDFIS